MRLSVSSYTWSSTATARRIGEIVERDSSRNWEPRFEAAHGVIAPYPVFGTAAYDSGITGHCTIFPEQHAYEDFDTHIEPFALAQDSDHWSETNRLQHTDLTIF